MLRFLINLCHRPRLRFGLGHDPRSRYRNTNFASFLAVNNGGGRDVDRHDAILRGRKVLRYTLTLLSGSGALWVIVESAKALSVF